MNHFSISIKTSDVSDGSTNDDVSITLNGTKGSWGPRELDNGANNFERGKIDHFIISNVPDIGMIESVTVSCDGSWSFEWVLVATVTASQANMHADNWWAVEIWNDQSLQALRDYLNTRFGVTHTYLFPWHNWIKYGGKSTQTIYEKNYHSTLSEEPGQTRNEYFCTICEVVNNLTGDSPTKRTISRSTGNTYTKSSGTGSQTGWSVGASATVGVQGEMVNASATITSSFNQMLSKKHEQAAQALNRSVESYEITVPAKTVTVVVQDWFQTVQTTEVKGGFDSSSINTPIDFRPGSDNQYSGSSGQDLMNRLTQSQPDSTYTELVRQRLHSYGLI